MLQSQSRRPGWCGRAAILVAVTLASATTHAENLLDDRFFFGLGAFAFGTDTDVRVDGDTRNGTPVDLEEDLGFQDKDSFRIDGSWRFRERHKVRLLWFENRRSASRQIDRDIEFRDTTFPVNGEVATSLDTSIVELAYEYAFLRRATWELAASAGLHVVSFDLALSATNEGGPGGPQTVALEESASVDGPFPVIGVRGLWALRPNLHIDAQAQFFKLSYDPYDGRLEDYNLSLIWMPFEHVGIGIGYNEFVTRVDIDRERFDGRLDWNYGGPRFFLAASF